MDSEYKAYLKATRAFDKKRGSIHNNRSTYLIYDTRKGIQFDSEGAPKADGIVIVQWKGYKLTVLLKLCPRDGGYAHKIIKTKPEDCGNSVADYITMCLKEIPQYGRIYENLWKLDKEGKLDKSKSRIWYGFTTSAWQEVLKEFGYSIQEVW